MSDIEIARRANMKLITDIAQERLGMDSKHLDPFGHYKAKLSFDYIDSLADKPDGNWKKHDGLPSRTSAWTVFWYQRGRS